MSTWEFSNEMVAQHEGRRDCNWSSKFHTCRKSPNPHKVEILFEQEPRLLLNAAASDDWSEFFTLYTRLLNFQHKFLEPISIVETLWCPANLNLDSTSRAQRETGLGSIHVLRQSPQSIQSLSWTSFGKKPLNLNIQDRCGIRYSMSFYFILGFPNSIPFSVKVCSLTFGIRNVCSLTFLHENVQSSEV